MFTSIDNSTPTPTTSCPSGDIYTLKVGLITASEATFAGVTGYRNRSIYLYNGQDYWTMSPYSWDINSVNVFVLDEYCIVYPGNFQYGKYGIRPVINLKADTTFASGDGTILSPYTVS